MFIEVPVYNFNENLKKDSSTNILLNPFQIISIDPSEDSPKRCIVWLTNSETLEINLSIQQLHNRIKEYLHENVLEKVYKEMRAKN